MKFTTLIPTRRNDGSAVSQAEWDGILNLLVAEFGGFSNEGRVKGRWLDSADGTIYQDASVKVTVACENSRMADVERIVLEIGRRLDQRAMYLEIQYFDGVRIIPVD